MFILVHRLSTIKKYSRTVVMNKGQIVEIGSHDDEKLGSIYEVKIEPNGEKITVEGEERYMEASMS